MNVGKELFKYNILNQAKNCSHLVARLMRSPLSHLEPKLFPYRDKMDYYSKEHCLKFRFTREDEHLFGLLYSVQFTDLENMSNDEWESVKKWTLDEEFYRNYCIEQIVVTKNIVSFSLDKEVLSINENGILCSETPTRYCTLLYDLRQGEFLTDNFDRFYEDVEFFRNEAEYYRGLEIVEKDINSIDKKIQVLETRRTVSSKNLQNSKILLKAIQNDYSDDEESKLVKIIRYYLNEIEKS